MAGQLLESADLPSADYALTDSSPTDSGSTGSSPTRARPKQLSWWLFGVAGLVFVMVLVGGATRLTQSGLSMVTWEPVSGAIPPLSEADWHAEFDSYRATPEYRLVNSEMTLSQFKGIFWWEFVHRFLGRIIGIALAVPFVWFLIRRAIPPGYWGRLAVLVLLVGLQGAIGWWMVASGLVDRPDVAHERLALHLVTALILLAALVWTALDLRLLDPHPGGSDRLGTGARAPVWMMVFTGLLFVQFILGAFVAGLDAGRIYNTWPRMHGSWIPRELTDLSPIWSNAVDNPVAVQFLHRWIAVVLAAVSLGVIVVLFRSGATKLATVFEVVVLTQFVLGVLTLLNAVPVALGVAHQAVGALLLVVTVVATHHMARVPAEPEPVELDG